MTVGELKKLLERCDDDFKVEITIAIRNHIGRPTFESSDAEFSDISYSNKVLNISAEVIQ